MTRADGLSFILRDNNIKPIFLLARPANPPSCVGADSEGFGRSVVLEHNLVGVMLPQESNGFFVLHRCIKIISAKQVEKFMGDYS